MTGNWNSILRLEKNKKGRDFVCGDIHGCFEEMGDKLYNIKFDKTRDRLFCVGDVIDRGPRSELAAYYLTRDWFFSVLGNHEYMFMLGQCNYSDRNYYRQSHVKNGGSWLYKMADYNMKELFEVVDKLPLIIQIEDTLIAHASIPGVDSLDVIEKDPFVYFETITWHRGEYPPLLIPGINHIFVGHNIVKEPIQRGKYINIDTGAFLKHYQRDGKLTVFELKNRGYQK